MFALDYYFINTSCQKWANALLMLKKSSLGEINSVLIFFIVDNSKKMSSQIRLEELNQFFKETILKLCNFKLTLK